MLRKPWETTLDAPAGLPPDLLSQPAPSASRLDRFLPPGIAQLPPAERRRFRLVAGAALVLLAICALVLLLGLGSWVHARGNLVSLAVSSSMVVLLSINLLILRRSRTATRSGVFICILLLVILTAATRGGLHGFPYQYFAAVPLLAAFLVGPRLAGACAVIAVVELCLFDGLVLGLLPYEEKRARLGSIFLTMMVGMLAALVERLRDRAERERDQAQARLLDFLRERASAQEEELRAQERRARHQQLRVDAAAAMADPGPLAACLERCCDAVLQHTGAALACVWMLDAGTLRLVASAGRPPRDGTSLTCLLLDQPGPGLVAREGRGLATSEVDWAKELWAHHEGVVAFAGQPLRVGTRLLGVIGAFTLSPPPGDLLEALGGPLDTIAQGIERKRAESALAEHAAELTRSNQELEQFAYVASHDLQEPLRMVASYNQLLSRRYRGKLDATADEFIGFSVDAALRMQRLIQDLLTYARVGTKGGALCPVDTGKVFRQVLANLEMSIREQEAEVSFAPLPWVHADEVQLGQLFQNLIGNALKFRSPEHPPRVHVSARQEGDEWVFSVQDDGIGIEPQYFERIFVIFQRLHAKTDYPGTGIGLAVCKRIVERHGGRIWVEPSPGQGTTFSFTLRPATPRQP